MPLRNRTAPRFSCEKRGAVLSCFRQLPALHAPGLAHLGAGEVVHIGTGDEGLYALQAAHQLAAAAASVPAVPDPAIPGKEGFSV